MNEHARPLLSIVVPTRDRPEYAEIVVNALRRQSFDDFEVIVSDNAVKRHFEPDPAVFDGVKFRYVRPPKPTWMSDHYEFATTHARGRYVGVQGDKSVLVGDALASIAAEIRDGNPDVVSWRVGNYQPATPDLAGRGVAVIPRREAPATTRIRPEEALDYLLATYLEPKFAPDHQLEIRGSIYHGVYSADLLRAMRSRFGQAFRYYAPDLAAQASGLQIARDVRHIPRALELTIAGPSNGVAVGTRVRSMLETQADAARGASGPSPSLIPGVSASIAHLLASDLAAISGRALRVDQWEELHEKAAYDLYYLDGWPEPGMFARERAALWKSAGRFRPALRLRLVARALQARRHRLIRRATDRVRGTLGDPVPAIRAALGRGNARPERREFERLFDALDARS